jgi:hypothetical protein
MLRLKNCWQPAMVIAAIGALTLGTGCTTTDKSGGSGASSDEYAQMQQMLKEAQAAAAEAKRAAASARGAGGGASYSYEPDVSADSNVSVMAFPTGDPATSTLLLHQVMPSEVQRAQEFDYEYHVTNITASEMQSVVLTASGFENLDVDRTSPSGTEVENGLMWNLGNMDPGRPR